MATDRWRQIEELFEAALEVDGAAREALLERAAARAPEIVAEVRDLLDSVEDSEGFLELPAMGGAHASTELEGRELGGFVVGRLLGRGGMGAVHLAVQRSPSRMAALKVMTAGAASATRRRRFEVESELLARLEHPAIARVYASGIEDLDGVEAPWFAMELVDGARDLLQFADDEDLGPRARVRLFLEVADALRYAHGRGVLHRDLKPSNLLVDPEGRPKVIDFGIARALDGDTTQGSRTALTLEGELLGTLSYMAPEQVGGGETDARTDVHGLGLVLYELLSGRPPRELSGRSLIEAAQLIEGTAPARPVEAVAALGEDVEWVLARALGGAPAERYPTVDALMTDLAALLDGRPVSVGPPTALYRLRRFVGRNRLAVGAAAAVLVALVGATVVSLLALERALDSEAQTRLEQEATAAALALAEGRRAEAEREADRALDARDFMRQLIVAPSPYRDGIHIRLADLLDDRAQVLDHAVSDDPQLEAAQRASLAIAYRGLGLDERALQHADRGRAIAAEFEIDPEVSDELLRASVRSLRALSRYGRAEELALERIELARGTERQADATLDLAELMTVTGRLEEAEGLTRELLATPDFALLGPTELLLGGILFERGQLDEAQRAFERCIQLMAESDPGEGTVTNGARNGLGLVLLERGEARAAVDQLTAVRARAVELYGPIHPTTTRVAGNLAAALRESGDPEAALALHEEVLGAAATRLGERSSTYLTARGNIAGTLKDLGRLDEAHTITAEVLATQREVLGDDHPDTLDSAASAARLLELLGRPGESERAFVVARELALRQLGERDERSISLGSELANALLGQGKYLAALEVLEPLAPIAGEVLAPGDPTAWRVPNNLGGTYRELGRLDEAEQQYRAALVAVGVDPPEEDPAGLFVLANLAETMRRQGAERDGIALLERVVEGYTARYGDRVPPTLQAESKLAWALYGAGDHAGAADLYASVLERSDGVYPPGHWTTAVWRGNRGAACEKLGRLEEARGELQRAYDELLAAVGAESSRTEAVKLVLDRVVATLDGSE